MTTMTEMDIIGALNAAAARKKTALTDSEVWRALEARFPGLRSALLELRAPSETLYISYELVTPRERAIAIDDGVMSIRELAKKAGVSFETARQARMRKRGMTA